MIARSVPEIHCTRGFVTRRTEEELGILVVGFTGFFSRSLKRVSGSLSLGTARGFDQFRGGFYTLMDFY